MIVDSIGEASVLQRTGDTTADPGFWVGGLERSGELSVSERQVFYSDSQLTGARRGRRGRLASAIPLVGLVMGFVCFEPPPADVRSGLEEVRARPPAVSILPSSPESRTTAAFVQIRDGQFR